MECQQEWVKIIILAALSLQKSPFLTHDDVQRESTQTTTKDAADDAEIPPPAAPSGYPPTHIKNEQNTHWGLLHCRACSPFHHPAAASHAPCKDVHLRRVGGSG